MKKVLSILGLIAILGITTPAFAGPHGPGGPAGHGPHGGVRIYTGHHHPRHSHWYGYRTGYWGSPWCDYRLGWCAPYYPCRPHAGVHFPIGGAGVSIRF